MNQDSHHQAAANDVTVGEYKCPQCGSDLHFAPGSAAQQCRSCGHTVDIATQQSAQEEIDFMSFLQGAEKSAPTVQANTASCPSCSAVSAIPANVTATSCPFCGTSITINGQSKLISPSALLPFRVDERSARGSFAAWTKRLWFAPSDFKRAAYVNERVQGIYLPYWTYDSFAKTRYSGQRGTYYYETERYTTTENGRSVTKTRQVRKTRWKSASGVVHNNFNDVLVPASKSLPLQLIERLEPWDLPQLMEYDAKYLSGFKSECYSVGLQPGFEYAKVKMQPTIDSTIRDDIGGDEQRIQSKASDYSQITFKHILLPIWISACRYRGKVYRFVVNGRTGEVQGDRPWSYAKIALAVIAATAIIITAFWVMQNLER
jgi:DNA-directed RNA polymerase subunit RPC12/RpoP